jgi:hypothetical protein
MPSRRLLIVATTAALAGGGSVAAAQTGGTPPAPPAQRARLRCPDLIMYRPYDLHYTRIGRRLVLRAGNSIVNRGTGPMELFGRRSGPRSMTVTQRIRRVGGGFRSFPTPGHLYFKTVPGYGSYWKFRNAARFELWSTDGHGHLGFRVRIGRKLIYCLRDLNKRFSNRFSPATRHFPGCGQDPNLRTRILGTSVGWSDDYPANYPEQWIDVTGLHGIYAFFMFVDPLNQLHESNEFNNRSPIVYLRLPPRPGAASSGEAGEY